MTKNYSVAQNALALVARIFIGAVFFVAAFQKIAEFDMMAQMMAKLSMGEWLLIVAIVLELAGSILLFLGWFTRFGAFLLFIFVILVALLFHSFWTFQEPAMVANQMAHFLKNVAMLGGLLYVITFGAGAISFDYFRRKHKE